MLCTSDRRAGSPIQQQTIWRSCTALVVSSCLYAGRGRRQYLAVPAAADRGQARESTQGLQAPRLRQPPWICNDVWPLPAAAAPALQLFDRRGRGMARGEAAAGIATAWLPGSGSVTSAGLHLRATCTESGALLPGAAHQQLGLAGNNHGQLRGCPGSDRLQSAMGVPPSCSRSRPGDQRPDFYSAAAECGSRAPAVLTSSIAACSSRACNCSAAWGAACSSNMIQPFALLI